MRSSKEVKPLKACRCCLSTSDMLEDLTELMRKVFYNICGLKAEPNDGQPQYVCTECNAQLRKALAIRRKSRRAHFILKQILTTKKVISKEDILKVNRHSAQLVSINNELWKPENSAVYSLLNDQCDEIDKPKPLPSLDDNTPKNIQKCTLEIQSKCAILVDIKPANYRDLDRIEEEKREQRKREEEEALRQIREEEDRIVDLDDNFDNDTTDDITDDHVIPPGIDPDDVFKDLKEPDDSDYSLSEPEEFNNKSEKSRIRGGNVNEDGDNVKNNLNDINVYNGSVNEISDACVQNPKLLNVLALAKMRHLSSVEEQKLCLVKRTQDIVYKMAYIRCSICVKILRTREELGDHVRGVHQTVTDIKCAICRVCFLDIKDLEVHQAWEHWYEYTCICGQMKYSLSDLIKHCEVKHALCPNAELEEEKIKQECMIRRRFDKILLRPQKWADTSIPEKAYICQICGMEYTTLVKLQAHSTRENYRLPYRGTIEYECEVCDTTLMSRTAMEYHFDSCHAHLYKCKGCQSIKTRFDAMKHLRCKQLKTVPLKITEIVVDKCFCVVCGETCTSQPLLLKHQLSIHRMIIVNTESMGDSKYLCCNTYFTNERAYYMHLLNEGHKAAKYIPLACVQCKILFADKVEMTNHVHIPPPPLPESEITRLKCKSCPEMFETMKQRERHEYRHYMQQILICEICGKMYRRYVKKTHMREHLISEESYSYSYPCQFCTLKFKRAERFVRHMLRYHIPQPYVCGICDRRFMDRYVCKTHILEVHSPEHPFECTKCGLLFVTWERHDQHLKKVHQIIVTKETKGKRKDRELHLALLCYPHMRLDGSAIPMDVIEKSGLLLVDYKEETKTEVPPEKVREYFIFDETRDIGTVRPQQSRKPTKNKPNPEQLQIENTRKRLKRQQLKPRQQREKKLAKKGKQQDLPENKMAADDDPHLKEEEEESEIKNEIEVSYVRNVQGGFTMKLENKSESEIEENTDQHQSYDQIEDVSISNVQYDDSVTHGPKDRKRKHKAQESEISGKRRKKQTFVGTKTKPQTGKSLGIIDGVGDIVVNDDHVPLLLGNNAQIGNKSVISVFNNPSRLYEDTKISDNDIKLEASGPNDISRIKISGIIGHYDISGSKNISGLSDATGHYDMSGFKTSGVSETIGHYDISGPKNISELSETGLNDIGELRPKVEETRLEIDAQELAENHEIVEIDGIHYVNIDNVLYKVEYS